MGTRALADLSPEGTKNEGSVKNEYFGLAKSSRFDFTITKEDFEYLQAGYQPKTTICNMEWSAKMIGADS